LKWLRNGAKPSETVEKLLKIAGTWDIFEGRAPEPGSAQEPADAPDPEPESEPEPAADVAEVSP